MRCNENMCCGTCCAAIIEISIIEDKTSVSRRSSFNPTGRAEARPIASEPLKRSDFVAPKKAGVRFCNSFPDLRLPVIFALFLAM